MANEGVMIVSLTVFTQRNFVAHLLQAVRFYTTNGHFVVLSPLWGLRDNVRCSS